MSCHGHEEHLGEYPAESLEWADAFPMTSTELLRQLDDSEPERVRVREVELPGMWEEADFMGGQDEVRP